MFRLGDKGLTVEYINYLLGVNSKEFTEETETLLKQFQASYRQIFTDREDEVTYTYDPQSGEVTPNNISYDPYSEYYKPGDSLEDFPNTKLYIFPNGVLDIYTLPALVDIEIPNFNTRKILQVQEALSWTKYTNSQPLKLSGMYDTETCEAITNFQRAHGLYQPYIPIVDNKNLLPNLESFWNNSSVDESTGELVDSTTIITSNFIALDFNNNNYIKCFTENYSIRIYFYNGPVGGNISSQGTYLSQNIANTDFRNYDDFSIWYDGLFHDEGLIPYCDCVTVNKATKIRVSVYNNGNPIDKSIIEKIQIQLEQNNEPTRYEPNSLNENNIFYSGYLNIPTYNAIKREFKLKEVE